MKMNNLGLLQDHTGQARSDIQTEINRPDIRPDNRIDFKISPVLKINIIYTRKKFHANRLNIEEVYPAGYPAGYPDHHQNQ